MDGILNINKPAGITSFGAVAQVKRLTGERHAGHAGTLDPDATGVLPVCLGKATRLVEFFMDSRKVYKAEIEMGVSTDTYDAAGKVTGRGEIACATPDLARIILDSFKGEIKQIPPMYSALKHQGRPLYALAREGVTVERKSRPVTIYRLELLKWQPPLMMLEIECSKGTYIRSLANDIGERLGCGAHLKTLLRSRYGAFRVEDALTPAGLEEVINRGDLEKYLYPIDYALDGLPAVTVDETGEEAIRTGNAPKLDDEIQDPGYKAQTHSLLPPEEKYRRAYSADGRFLAILARDKEAGIWRPKKVFI